MTARNLESRIGKLEGQKSRPDEILVIWRRPDADVRVAIGAVQFAPGDRVICAEWFDPAPLPAPRWHKDRLSSAMDRAEYEHIMASLERVAAGDRPRDSAFVDPPALSLRRIRELPDNELLQMVLGVAA